MDSSFGVCDGSTIRKVEPEVLQDHSRFLKRIYSLIIWALAPNADRQISDYILLKRLSASLGGNRSAYHRRRLPAL